MLFRSSGAKLHLVAGTINGHIGPLNTFAQPTLAFGTLEPSHPIMLSLEPELDMAIYVLTGSLMCAEQAVTTHQLIHFKSTSEQIKLSALEPATFVILGGPEINERLVRYGPFVTNSEQEMQQAIADYHNGKFGYIDKS